MRWDEKRVEAAVELWAEVRQAAERARQAGAEVLPEGYSSRAPIRRKSAQQAPEATSQDPRRPTRTEVLDLAEQVERAIGELAPVFQRILRLKYCLRLSDDIARTDRWIKADRPVYAQLRRHALELVWMRLEGKRFEDRR